MRNGHFDYGNGFHGRVYLNPHQLFRHPSTIWRLAQDLLEMLPGDLLEQTEVVAGPVMGGALLAHTLAGLLDGRRALTHPPCSFAPFSSRGDNDFTLRNFYAREMAGKRVLIADDVRNTGKTFQRCAELVRQAGGTVIGHGRDLRSHGGGGRRRRAELRAGGVQGAGELRRRGLPDVQGRRADHELLAADARMTRIGAAEHLRDIRPSRSSV